MKTTLTRLSGILKMFYEIADDEYKKNLKALTDIKEMKKIFITLALNWKLRVQFA